MMSVDVMCAAPCCAASNGPLETTLTNPPHHAAI